MSSKLVVHVKDSERSAASVASARVRRVSGLDGAATDDRPAEHLIRTGIDLVMPVSPGHFVVDVIWRNGKRSRRQCVVKTAEVQHLEFLAPALSRVPDVPTRDFTRPSAGGMFKAVQSHEVFAADDYADTWRFVCDRQRIEQQSQLPLTSLGAERSQDVKVVSEAPGVRNWVEYWRDGGWAVASMPFSPLPGPAECVLRSAPEGVPYVVSADPETGVMMDLIPAGNSEAMRSYAEIAFKSLTDSQKIKLVFEQPIEACAFAYAEYDRFDGPTPWIALLTEIHRGRRWLPDLAVILGWRELMRARDDKGTASARRLLKQGIAAGVPFYSMGVRLLAEALSATSSDDEASVEDERLVEAVALRTLATETLTTVRP